jgi:FkbM family methyltransferase
MRVPRHLRLKANELVFEARFLARLGQTWPERLSIAKMVVKLFGARLMPFNTLGWESTIKVRGAEYVIGLRTSEVFIFHEIYEMRQYDRLADFVPLSGWTVFDAGANIGVFTVLQGKRGADVYAFEPNPDSYRRLQQNVSANCLGDRVHLLPSALGDAHGTGTIRVVDGGTTGGIVSTNDEAGDQGAPVTITTLDQVVTAASVKRIDLLKIDVEGSEVLVLRGAQRSLGIVERVIIEYHSRDLLRSVEEILVDNGFSQEMILDYYAEDAGRGQDEVGILYAQRSPARAASGQSH